MRNLMFSSLSATLLVLSLTGAAGQMASAEEFTADVQSPAIYPTAMVNLGFIGLSYPEDIFYRADGGWAVTNDFRRFYKNISGTKSRLSFERLSDDGAEFVLAVSYTNPAFVTQKVFVSKNKDKIDIEVRAGLESCNTEPLSINYSDNRSTDIREMIAQLRRLDFKKFLTCEFTVNKIVWGDTLATRDSEMDTIVPCTGKLILLRDGTLQRTSQCKYRPEEHSEQTGPQLQTLYRPTAQAPGSPEAIAAVETFHTLLHRYGGVLEDAAAVPANQALERDQMIQEWKDRYAKTLAEQLDTIDREFSKLSLIDKIGISVSIRRAYQYVEKIRARAQISNRNRLDLDEYVDRFSRY